MATTPDLLTETVATAATEFERAMQRNLKGLEYFTTAGPQLGASPKDVLIERGTMRLYRYRPVVDDVYRVPILLVMATTNRGYIFDMVPGQSLIEYLGRAGFDVFMLDWEAPRADEKSLTLASYVLDFLPAAVARLKAETGEPDVTVVGYCFGGVLALLWAALEGEAAGCKNLVTFTTPVDFSAMEMFQSWADRRFFDVDRLVDTLGNCPGDYLYTAFDMLRPAARAAQSIRVVGPVRRRRLRQELPDVRSLVGRHPAAGGRIFPRDHQGVDVGQSVARRHHGGGGATGGPGPNYRSLSPRRGAARPYRAHRRQRAATRDGRFEGQGGGGAEGRARQPGRRRQCGEAAVAQAGRVAGAAKHMSHTIRRFAPADRDAMVAFVATLPGHDLLFLGRDLTHPRVIAAWLDAIAEGWIDSLIAIDADSGEVVGTAALVRDPLGWSAHVGEVRLLVGPAWRGAGLGRDLLEAVFGIAQDRGLAKLSARMTPDQTGSVALFEGLGFRAEALLKDQVRGRDGRPHDLAILSLDPARAAAHARAFGETET